MQMITALLDVKKFESGEMAVSPEDRDIVATAREALDSLGGLVSTRNVKLEGDEGGVVVAHDPQLTERIIANLVSNALRHTPEDGRVSISVTSADGRARVDVQDEGPGIPEEYRDRIFEKFGQVEAQQGRVATTGLGLTFCALAVQAHGGDIGVESEIGAGSTFWFELPLA